MDDFDDPIISDIDIKEHPKSGSQKDGVNKTIFNEYKSHTILCQKRCKMINDRNPWFIVEKENENDTNRILFVIPGFSHGSYSKVVRDINIGYDHIKDKYKKIIILKFGDLVKSEQTLRLTEENLRGKEKVNVENKLYLDLAIIIHKLINQIRDFNRDYIIDILGKSAGGGVSVMLTKIDPRITNLYLSVPAIINQLDEIKIRPLDKFKMHLNKDDPIVKYDENYEKFQTQSKSLYGEDVVVYDTGGHELISEFLNFL
jgi:hypothetical protein